RWLMGAMAALVPATWELWASGADGSWEPWARWSPPRGSYGRRVPVACGSYGRAGRRHVGAMGVGCRWLVGAMGALVAAGWMLWAPGTAAIWKLRVGAVGAGCWDCGSWANPQMEMAALGDVREASSASR
uniref:Uncharacterized protein n=1 Tax=Aegilops tauschii subsp. strangulata TaxID=200361 RepID=A0A453AEP2_AEGTS